LASLISLLRSEGRVYKEIEIIDTNTKYKEQAENKAKQLERFESALDTMLVTADVYQKRLEINKTNINKDVNTQMVKIAKIGVIVSVVFVIFFLLKLVVKKYITDHERFYMANKIITFVNFTLIDFNSVF